MKKALLFGIGASFFFSFTFVLNRQMNIGGGSWYWSSSLRYLFMLPILFFIVTAKKQLFPVIKDIKKNPIQWFIWSTVGFGFFYAPLSFASAYGASWLVAGTWQLTIIAGALMSPLFYTIIDGKKIKNHIPKKFLLVSLIILIGIFLMLSEEARKISLIDSILVVVPVLFAAFSYPLGNRKMMELCNNRLNTLQRVFGMTMCSIPFWIIIVILGVNQTGIPSHNQIIQSLIVAVSSGVIATIMFFKATDIVKGDSHKLAVIESTQVGELIFTLLGGVFIFNDNIPTVLGIIGIILVAIGMVVNSFIQE
ncbi:DMT family transporter [Fusobacterium varium]|jgi:drug/metabolite transporter (DMT)-like permease|uniref:Multidrug resistance efflux transporter family protein n=1 Tax=Fusobacterium varium ATCC 27725 TaxID=469618 RepID=A0ABN5JMH9_FUSVA|nr:multidrug resistance efflux transporter family protein [Fusobacterium varium]AVQ32491.1 multidrug resistance efflux transporter family protein [Fusobacterium varium ATCC 27725]EES64433.1 hypothetical protein FVAG_01924 [Fusobacterium varium ATCC 27725]VEH38530.1 Uncharacterised protein [Fusobacterium varium]